MKRMRRSIALAVCLTVLLAWAAVASADPFSVSGPPAFDVDTDPATVVPLNPGMSGIITDLNLTVNITTPYANDLNIYLVHGGVTVQVYATTGDDGAAYINATFDDEAGGPYPGGSVDGTFQPSPGALSAFDGMELDGQWQLVLEEAQGYPNDGTDLVSWSISGDATGLQVVTVPTMNEWGMMAFMVLAGLGGAYMLAGRRNEA